MSGVGVAKDSTEAKALIAATQDRLWEKASPPVAAPENTLAAQAEKGDAQAQHNLAFEFEQQKKYDEALKWYLRAAERGYGLSEMNLAQMYEKGIGVKQDFTEAKKWYRKGVERGGGEALFRLASLSEKTGSGGDSRESRRPGQRLEVA